jgi:predicted esterase
MPPPPSRFLRFLTTKCPAALRSTKIIVLNGSHDQVAPPGSMERAKRELSGGGLHITYETMPNATHQFTEGEVAHLAAVLDLVVPKK